MEPVAIEPAADRPYLGPMGFLLRDKSKLPSASEALPGRADALAVAARHAVSGGPMSPPWPDGAREAMFGLGCFWGAERKFWQLDGVISTQVGYAAGHTPNPTYQEVCSGRTGHNEVVRVVYDPAQITFGELLGTFWESHDPTQGMRQGNDAGTQYRSGIYTYDPNQQAAAQASRAAYAAALSAAAAAGATPAYGPITTEIVAAGPFYYAEDYHQQYLAKNPGGYCGVGGTGVACPVGADVKY